MPFREAQDGKYFLYHEIPTGRKVSLPLERRDDCRIFFNEQNRETMRDKILRMSA